MNYYGQTNGGFGSWGMPARLLTPAVKRLMIANGVVFVLQILFFNNMLETYFGLSAYGMRRFMIWQLATYMFLHSKAQLWHIILNMLALFFFGPETERAIGTKRFTILYFISGILGGLGWLIISGTSGGVCIGASGAVFGILGAFAAMFPKRPVTLLVFFILPVTMQARTLVFGLGLIQLLSLIVQPHGIAYAAHLAGGVAGYLYALTLVRTGFGSGKLNIGKWINDIKWEWQRKKFKVVNNKNRPWTRTHTGPKPSGNASPEEVDRILEKISKWGIHTLTREEHEILDKASRRQ